jgi:uncharacterized protein YaaQ
MKLLICVVNEDDASALIGELTGDGYRATRIGTTGGFLRQGNATLLIGVDDHQVDDVLRTVQGNCRARTTYANPIPLSVEPGTAYMPMPIEVKIGGAIVFVLDVTQFEKF